MPTELIIQSKQALPIQSIRELVISGQDIMEWLNKPGGPWLKVMLHQIEHAVLHKK